MNLKTKLVLLLTTISILITQIDVIYGIDVDMNENFTATVGEVGEINCSFSKENIQTLYTVGFFSRNKTTHIFEQIVTFRPNEVTVFTPAGKYLRSRVTVTNINLESNEATILFNHLKCTDQTQYLCEVTYFSSTLNTVVSDRSLPTTINVTVLPQKPNISSSIETTNKDNHDVEKRSISGNDHFNRTGVTHTTRENEQEYSSTRSTITVDEGEQFPLEGDNVTFVCSGNVGRPPGFMLWQKIYAYESRSFSYVNETTTIEKIPGKCSFNGTSNLTFQLSAADFKARVRCSVFSQDGIQKMYIETDPLDLYFSVRHVSIIKLPNKDNFDPSIKNITLICNSDGNPEPRFSWYKGQNTSNILSRSNKYVINNVIKNNSGMYICEVYNFISGEQFNASSSIDITIENINDSSEDTNNNLEKYTNVLIGIGIAGGFFIFALIISYICRRRAKRKRLRETKDKATSETFNGNCAEDNPCYRLDSGTSIDETLKDSANAMDAGKNNLENDGKFNGKQEKMDIEFGNPTNQTNKEAASYAYVTVSSDYHVGKDSNEMLKPPTINEKNIPSTTESSKSAKENLNENTCDNSSDHYASSIPDVYDVLNDNRYKPNKGETFDSMFELKSLPENRNKSNPINLENSRRGGYDSVVIDGDKPVISSEKNSYGHDDPQTIRQHNEEHIDHQKQEEKKINESPIPNQTVEYAQVNEATKLKNKTKSNDTDQTTVNVGASAILQKGINGKSKDMTTELIMDHIDTPKKNTTRDETESLNKSRLRERNNTQSFVNDGKEKGKVAIVSPFVGSSVKSEGDTQEENTNAEIQQEIKDISGQTVDNAQNFGTNNQKNQQTNGDPEPSLKYNQTEPHTNQTFDNEEYPKIDSLSMNDIQDEGQVDQNSEQQSSNDYEKVQIEQNQ